MSRTHLITCLASAAAAVVLGVAQSSCTDVDCGTGTINKDGTCTPAEDNPSNANCGPGTVLKNGHCETTVTCGANTVAQTNADGTVTCVGTGGQPTGCTDPIPCTQPGSGKMTICGQILNVDGDVPLKKSGATGAMCAAGDTDGPCALTVTPYDAIQFGADPDNATPLPNTEQLVDDCGRFRITNISPMAAAYIGVGIQGKSGVTTYRRTGVAVPTATGKAFAGLPGYVLSAATDSAWSTAANLGAGGTFTDRGVYMAIFRTTKGTVPVAGVTITAGGAASPANDYYFSDTAASSRATIAPAQNATGANGSGLMIGDPSHLTQYSGMGGEPSGCKWPSDPAEQIPDVIFVQPRIAVLSTSTTTVCP